MHLYEGYFLNVPIFNFKTENTMWLAKNCVHTYPFRPKFSNKKSYPPNFKGVQSKTKRKWCFLSPYQKEFCSKWQPCTKEKSTLCNI